MSTAQWTKADLAQLTAQALEQAYCTNCQITLAQEDDELCAGCLDSIIAHMAELWEEEKAMSFCR